MRGDWFGITATGKASLVLAMAISIGVQSTVPVWAFGLPFGQKNNSTFQAPINEKLTPGAGPAVDDDSDSAATPSAPAADTQPSTQPSTSGASVKQDLTPLTLDGDTTSSGTGAAATPDDPGLLKASVRENKLAPKAPADHDDATKVKSVKPDSKEKEIGLQQAKAVNVMPLPLMASAEETDKKIDTKLEAEKAELSDLWDATLTRSPDIQFVVQKLMPTNKPGHTSTIMMRALSMALFGAMGAAGMVMPNMAMGMATQSSSSMLVNMLMQTQGAQAKKAKLSQEEMIMLYDMVRKTADKVVENYHDYKKMSDKFTRAAAELADTQQMAADAGPGQSPADQIRMNWTLKTAQRDVDSIGDDVRKYRQALVDLAGNDAVMKLDKQIADEQTSVNNTTQIAEPVPVPADAGDPSKPVTADASKAVDDKANAAAETATASKADADQTAAAVSPPTADQTAVDPQPAADQTAVAPQPAAEKTAAAAPPVDHKTAAVAAPAVHKTAAVAAPGAHKTAAVAAPAAHKTAVAAQPAAGKKGVTVNAPSKPSTVASQVDSTAKVKAAKSKSDDPKQLAGQRPPL